MIRALRSSNASAWLRSTTVSLGSICLCAASCLAAPASPWIPLFDGKSLEGWKPAENPRTWAVNDGCLTADGPRSHLFYAGPVGRHTFRNFELEVEARAEAGCNSGVYFHTRYQETGWPSQGYEVQINSSHRGTGDYVELKRTGSLYGVRNIYPTFVEDGEWFRIRLSVVGNRIRIWVNDQLTVDYLQPNDPYRSSERPGRRLSRGTFALQGHDEESRVSFRKIAVRTLPETADPNAEPRASDTGYGLTENRMDRLAAGNIPFIDYHIHLRGGMTLDKALARQAVTGINSGVLRNLGTGWPLETDAQFLEFLETVKDRPVFVGLQVNDRDWMDSHSPELLRRLDFVLADTMIMPMPDDNGAPQKLWLADQYTIEDPDAWMERYLRHNLRILSEPVTILANPTYLPPAVADQYDRLWTETRMRQVIEAAVRHRVAIEIQARSEFPRDRFIRLAKEMGAKFSFGSNNFDDRPIDMTRCLEIIERFGLGKDDLYVPGVRLVKRP